MLIGKLCFRWQISKFVIKNRESNFWKFSNNSKYIFSNIDQRSILSFDIDWSNQFFLQNDSKNQPWLSTRSLVRARATPCSSSILVTVLWLMDEIEFVPTIQLINSWILVVTILTKWSAICWACSSMYTFDRPDPSFRKISSSFRCLCIHLLNKLEISVLISFNPRLYSCPSFILTLLSTSFFSYATKISCFVSESSFPLCLLFHFCPE